MSTDDSSRDAREYLNGNKDGGVSCSSEETSNDRGAKGWQIVTSVRDLSLAIFENENGQTQVLENIITNPIDAPRGYKNPIHGIALRGPLSQFFSGLYLKPLDDAFLNANVSYFRFQDDVLILCKTKRAMDRCRRRMMAVLHERHLRLSRKKSRMGSINNGFHYLGIQYSPTQTENKAKVTHANDVQYLDGIGGGGDNF